LGFAVNLNPEHAKNVVCSAFMFLVARALEPQAFFLAYLCPHRQTLIASKQRSVQHALQWLQWLQWLQCLGTFSQKGWLIGL
jgi:hypothetical protein